MTRALEKAAVVAGGGANHRMGLFDRVLVKDNHLALAGAGLAHAVAQARRELPGIVVEVEADDRTASGQRCPPAPTGSCSTT